MSDMIVERVERSRIPYRRGKNREKKETI